MDLSDIERVVAGGEGCTVLQCCVKVVEGLVVVVVVAHGVEYLYILYLLVDGLDIVGDFVFVVVPVEVPCHVAECDGIHLLSAA